MMRRSFRYVLVGVLLALPVALWALPPQRSDDWRHGAIEAFDVVWQTVYDTHYDDTFGGVDWAAAREDLRPLVERAADPAAARTAIRTLLARLRQSHFRLISSAEDDAAPYGEATVSIELRPSRGGWITTQVASGSSAEAVGIRPGDRLLSVDGAPVGDVRAAGFDDGVFELFQDVLRRLSGPADSKASLTFSRPDGSIYDVVAAREREEGEIVQFGNLPPMRARLDAQEVQTASGRRIGIIAFNIWMTPLAEPFAAAIDRFRDADGLLIDLSGNVGGIVEMLRGVSGHVLDEPLLIGRMQMRSSVLEFRANPRRVTSAGRLVQPYAGPLAIVVDGLTASASECFAAGLQGLGRARVFGTRTLGQALPAMTKTLPTGDVLEYAVGDFVTSRGERVEGVGVVPDELVPLEPLDLREGRTARMRAVAWLDSQPGR